MSKAATERDLVWERGTRYRHECTVRRSSDARGWWDSGSIVKCPECGTYLVYVYNGSSWVWRKVRWYRLLSKRRIKQAERAFAKRNSFLANI